MIADLIAIWRARNHWLHAARLLAALLLLPSDSLEAEDLRGGTSTEGPIRLESGVLVGPKYEADKIRCVIDYAGFDIKWTAYPTNRLLSMAEHLDLDLIFPMGFTKERDSNLTRSEYLLITDEVFVYRLPKPDFSDKAHIRVGARLGSPQLTTLMNREFRHVEVSNSNGGLLKMFESGRIDTFVLSVRALTTLNLSPELKTELFDRRQVGFYVGKNWRPDLLQALNRAILKCRD